MTRAWDGYDAYLFDIDGTLLHCTDAVHYLAFCNALSAIAGRPLNLDGVVAHGNVDNGILRDAFTLAGVPEDAWRPRLPEVRAAMCREVAANRADLRAGRTPGVEELLQHLRTQGAKLGVATGNLQSIGRLKLEACGLLPWFDFAGWSDAFETRADVFAHALERAREAAGAAATVCVVGDTPADVRAAQANGLDVIAVATGTYSLEALQRTAPTRCIPNFNSLLTQAR